MRRSPQHRVADDRCGGERLRLDKWLYDSRENGNSGEWTGFGDACLRWHDGIVGCIKSNVTNY
jgi:hypothetical protein